MASAKQITDEARVWANRFLSQFTDVSGPAAGLVEDWLVRAYQAGYGPGYIQGRLDELEHGPKIDAAIKASNAEVGACPHGIREVPFSVFCGVCANKRHGE